MEHADRNDSYYKLLIDEELFTLTQRGDQRAYTIIYNKYAPMLYTLALRYLKDAQSAENAIQNVFIRLWEFRSDISVTINLRNYLYTMTKNFIMNYIRNEQRAMIKNYEIYQGSPHENDELLENLISQETYERLMEAISKLPRTKQIIIEMKRNGCSNQEVADKLNLSINTIKTHYAQSVKILKTALKSLIVILTAIHI